MNLAINNANRTSMEAINQVAMAVPASKVDKNDFAEANLSVSSVAGEAEIEISDEDLRRDDALGKLFDQAFSLPAPAMPNFPEV